MYTYKITNIVSAPFWIIGSIESNLRAFCSFNGLSIDIFTSGLIFKDMSFVIRGECKERGKRSTRAGKCWRRSRVFWDNTCDKWRQYGDNMETTNNETNGIYLAGSEHQSSESINLTGNWFVNFGADLPDCSIEGSRILTLKGNFDPDTLMDVLVENLYNDLPEKGKEMLNKYNQPTKRLVIRAFNRI